MFNHGRRGHEWTPISTDFVPHRRPRSVENFCDFFARNTMTKVRALSTKVHLDTVPNQRLPKVWSSAFRRPSATFTPSRLKAELQARTVASCTSSTTRGSESLCLVPPASTGGATHRASRRSAAAILRAGKVFRPRRRDCTSSRRRLARAKARGTPRGRRRRG